MVINAAKISKDMTKLAVLAKAFPLYRSSSSEVLPEPALPVIVVAVGATIGPRLFPDGAGGGGAGGGGAGRRWRRFRFQ